MKRVGSNKPVRGNNRGPQSANVDRENQSRQSNGQLQRVPRIPTQVGLGAHSTVHTTDAIPERLWPKYTRTSIPPPGASEPWYQRFPERLIEHAERSALDEFLELEGVLLRRLKKFHPVCFPDELSSSDFSESTDQYLEGRQSIQVNGKYRWLVGNLLEWWPLYNLRVRLDPRAGAPTDAAKELARVIDYASIVASLDICSAIFEKAENLKRAVKLLRADESPDALSWLIQEAFNLGSLSRLYLVEPDVVAYRNLRRKLTRAGKKSAEVSASRAVRTKADILASFDRLSKQYADRFGKAWIVERVAKDADVTPRTVYRYLASR